MGKVIVFVSYTMLKPIVGGAFIRCVRLATEMARRGWLPVICNNGPIFNDPKVAAVRGMVRFIQLDKSQPGFCAAKAEEQFRSLKPSMVVMGESPFREMEVFYEAARRQRCPFIVLDQYYNDWLLPKAAGVDLVLLYGLASFWPDLRLPRPYEVAPPFIQTVMPRADLPVPPEFQNMPWIATVAYDGYVLQRSMDLLARLAPADLAIVSMSRNPVVAKLLATRAGWNPARVLALPLQDDETTFGFLAASAVSVVSDGFLQIMDCLALASPVVAIDRGTLEGQSELNIADRFQPYVSRGDPPERQMERIREWLANSPFSQDLRTRLDAERYGVSYCANRIEAIGRVAGGHRLAARISRSSMRTAAFVAGKLLQLR